VNEYLAYIKKHTGNFKNENRLCTGMPKTTKDSFLSSLEKIFPNQYLQRPGVTAKDVKQRLENWINRKGKFLKRVFEEGGGKEEEDDNAARYTQEYNDLITDRQGYINGFRVPEFFTQRDGLYSTLPNTEAEQHALCK
jgi:hypothetical protein